MDEEVHSSDAKKPDPTQQPAADTERLRELEQQVALLERELSQYRQKVPFWTAVRRKIKPILVLAVAVLLAAIPAWLVFRDRWQGAAPDFPSLSQYWQQIPVLVKSSLPAYFLIIFLCTLALAVWLLFTKSAGPTIFNHPGAGVVPPTARRPSARQEKIGKLLLAGALVIALATFLYGWFTTQVPGIGFMLALLAYLAAWLCLEVSFPDLWQRLWTKREPILSFLIFQIALIWLLRNLAFSYQLQWLSVLLFVLAAVNIFRFIRQIPAVLWVINLAIVLFTININSWAFSVIGDDFAFFNHALRILEIEKPLQVLNRLFDGQAVYSTHPYLSSLLQALSMAAFGRDNFGWRFSNLFLSAISIGLFYLFFKRFLKAPIAILIAILLAGSAYLMTFGKIGYNNLQALFTLALGLWAVAWAVQSDRPLAYVTAGLSIGLCFYVYPAALYGPFLCLLLMFIYKFPRSRPAARSWLLFAFSLLMMILPLFLQVGYWQAKIPGLLVNNPEITQSAQSTVDHFVTNLIMAFYSFLYIVHESHFVVASYVDPIGALFVLLGLAYTFKFIARERFAAFLIAGLAILLVLVGASHDRQTPPTTRMFLMLPWFMAFLAIGVNWTAEQILGLELFRIKKTTLLAVALALILAANLYQAYALSPQRSTGQQSMEVMYVRLLEKVQNFETVSDYPKTFVFLTDAAWGIDGYRLLNQVYNVPAAQVNLRRVIVQDPNLPAPTTEFLAERNTLVIIQPGMDEARKQALNNQMVALGKFPCEVKEYSEKDIRFTVWLSPDLAPICK